jgi:murein DD-endopeptidase MepM/ murein hydrolase activator NlpD
LTALVLAGPALANSSSSADVTAPLRAAQAARQPVSGGEDEQFARLFRNWQSLEGSGAQALAAITNASGGAGIGSPFVPAVSIPSLAPVSDFQLRSGFGVRRHPIRRKRRMHKGADLAAPIGTPIVASADGIISRADWFGSYGLYVAIEHGSQIQTRYGHMSRLNVAVGQRVSRGEVIGFVGSTGRSTGPHLHYEVRIADEAVDPLPYIQSDPTFLAASPDQPAMGGPE